MQLGVMPPNEALSIASEQKLVLREVSPTAEPPVWKLFTDTPPSADNTADSGMQEPPKAAPKKEAVKKAKPPKIKEVRMTDKSDLRDADTKAMQAVRFIEKGHVVRVIALNTGRKDKESGNTRAQMLVERVLTACAELADHEGVSGKTKLSGAPTGKQILGRVEATLTPKGGPSRGEMTPRRERPPKRQRERPK